MLERCPLCRARLQWLSTCQRCGADLMIPIRIEGEAHGRYLHSVALAMEGDIEAARLAADQAMHLKAQPLFGFWCAFLDSTAARPVTDDRVESQIPRVDGYLKGTWFERMKGIFR